MSDIVTKFKKRFVEFQSGKKKTFVKATQKFFLQLKMTDPKHPSKLVDLPKGIRVRLMNKGAASTNTGAAALTDEKGKVCLAPDTASGSGKRDFHFRIDLDERTYIDIDRMELVPSHAVKFMDDRKLMELPMIVDTVDGGFYYDERKLKLTGGMLKDYDASKAGEGSEGDPIVLEVRFYWYFLKFKYYDRIKSQWCDVPAGMPIVPRLDADEDYLHKYLLKGFPELDYLLDSEEKKIQHFLNLLGFKCGKVDGIVGEKTRAGIKAFQKHFELKVDGIAGPITKRTLEQVFYRRHTGIYKENTYVVPAWKKKSATWSDIHFETALPVQVVAKTLALTSAEEVARFDLYLYTKDKGSAPTLICREKIAEENKDQNNKPVAYDELEFVKQRHYYDLPVEWSSRNYWVRFDNSMDKGARYQKAMKEDVKLFPYDPDENKRSKTTKPLMFSLDDIVLLKADGSQEIKDKSKTDASIDLRKDTAGKKDGSRLSLFYVKPVEKDGVKSGELRLHAPEEDKKPYFSKVTTDSANYVANIISNVPENPLLVVFANDFYAIGKRRAFGNNDFFKFHHKTTQNLSFDADKHVKGCRAAILSNNDVHAGEVIRYTHPPVHTRYFADGTGNFELHYLHQGYPIEGGPDGLAVRSFLMIYWNGEFSKKDYIGNVTLDAHGNPDQNPDAHAMTDADIIRFETEGLANAKERWEHKGYTLEPFKMVKDGGTCKVQIRPVFFFEAKQSGIGGKPKCIVEISNDQNAGSMGVNASWMYWPDYKIRDYLGVGQFTDIDGKHFETLVVAHELGHAEGKDDDYAYHDRFNQYYSGMPYQYDIGSMMNDNRAPRMRNLWNFLNWINDRTGDTDANPLKNLLGANEFKMVHRFKKAGAEKVLNYHLPRAPGDYRDVYKPYKKEINKSVGTGRLDLALYKLGEDETALNLKVNTNMPAPNNPIQFDGILAVYIKVAFRFVNSAARNWTHTSRRTWRNSVNSMVKKLNDRFIIKSSSGDHDFKSACIAFFPVFIESTSVERHYRVTVTIESPTNINTLWTDNNTNLAVGHNTCEYDIVSYFLGHRRNSLARKRGEPANPAIVKADLEFMRIWFRDQLGDDDHEVSLVEV